VTERGLTRGTCNTIDDWRDLAACRGKPTAWWFPDRGDTFELVLARRVCAGCPVRSECLAFALGEPDIEGVWCGMTAQQRRRMRPV
jgi:WhiB family redox-sensing transcriptional regulator